MRIYKEFQEEAVRGWNPKDSIFYPLTNFNCFPVLFKVMKKCFPKFSNSFTVKICYKEGGNYLTLCLIRKLATLLLVSLLPGGWGSSRHSSHSTLSIPPSVLLYEMKVIMLLMVQVQPLCTFTEMFVLFLVSQVLVPCVIAMLFAWFYLIR